MKHRNTYMMVYSPTSHECWAFDRGYHFLGTETEYWYPIAVHETCDIREGVFCTSNLPVEEAEKLEQAQKCGHRFLTIWTKYFG